MASRLRASRGARMSRKTAAKLQHARTCIMCPIIRGSSWGLTTAHLGSDLCLSLPNVFYWRCFDKAFITNESPFSVLTILAVIWFGGNLGFCMMLWECWKETWLMVKSCVEWNNDGHYLDGKTKVDQRYQQRRQYPFPLSSATWCYGQGIRFHGRLYLPQRTAVVYELQRLRVFTGCTDQCVVIDLNSCMRTL